MNRVTRRFLWKIWQKFSTPVKIMLEVLVGFVVPWLVILFLLEHVIQDSDDRFFSSVFIWMLGFILYHVVKRIFKFLKTTWQEAKYEISRENREIMNTLNK